MNKIVAICGSMKFQTQMMELAQKLELEEGYIVLQCVYIVGNRVLSAQELRTLNELHYKKIDISDTIYVVNPGGYIGASTRKEIEYACSLKKEILYLE